VDKLDREDRQGVLDEALKALRDEQERLRLLVEARSARNRRALIWITIGLIVALLIAGWVAYDRYSAFAMVRVWTGGGAALAWAFLRGR
jgi:cytochrome c-type biogenesis protein CcmH/NrfG